MQNGIFLNTSSSIFPFRLYDNYIVCEAFRMAYETSLTWPKCAPGGSPRASTLSEKALAWFMRTICVGQAAHVMVLTKEIRTLNSILCCCPEIVTKHKLQH